jgi:hypothetical protein
MLHHYNRFLKTSKERRLHARKTPVLSLIVKALGHTAPHTLARLENAFKASLLVVAGGLDAVAHHAEQLRLAVITEECAASDGSLDQAESIHCLLTGLWRL